MLEKWQEETTTRLDSDSDGEDVAEVGEDTQTIAQNSKTVIKRYLEQQGRQPRGRQPRGRQPPRRQPRRRKPRGKSWQQAESKPRRRKPRGKSWQQEESKYAKLDDKRMDFMIEVQELRYSQLSCKDTFQCGRSVSQLVQDLLDGTVSLSADFLRLTVFETLDEATNEPILRCIDNRRLHALKEYAEHVQQPVYVRINLFSLDTLKQVERFKKNSDDTDGYDVKLRSSRKRKQWKM